MESPTFNGVSSPREQPGRSVTYRQHWEAATTRTPSVIAIEPHDGADVLARVRTAAAAGTDVILLTPRRDALAVTAALHHGARSYICLQPQPSSASAVQQVAVLPRPRIGEALALSEREREIVQGLADGLSNTEIGKNLNISALTVKSHLARIGSKLHLGDRAAIVACVLRAGLID